MAKIETLTEEFDSLPDWTEYADEPARWVVGNGVLSTEAEPAATQSKLCPPFAGLDVVCTADLMASPMDAGLVARLQSNDRYYLASIVSYDPALVAIWRRSAGLYTKLASTERPLGLPARFGFSAIGLRLTAYLEDIPVLEAIDLSGFAILDQGLVGVRRHEGTPGFERFAAERLVLP